MLVKICGITRLEDAEAAVAAGADAIGFVFWPESPRFIDPFRAARIAAALPPFVTPVGVFVNQRADYINAVAARVKLGAVQLHGDEGAGDLARINRPIVKAVAIGAAGVDPAAWPGHVTLLLDAHDPSRRGGTGRRINWNAAASIARVRRIVLAGGLTPENVGEAVARVRPFGIDVSSGVEQSPGVKNHGRIRALFEALHAATHDPARS
jgi:phosphoribosylanthranilate isomerase